MSWAGGLGDDGVSDKFCGSSTVNVTGSAKRGLIAFLNFQLQLVTIQSVFSL